MIKIIFQTSAAFFAESSFPDLTGLLLLKYLLADAKCSTAVSALFRQIGRKGIVPIEDQLHAGDHLHGLFQIIHRDIDLPVAVQLIPEQICKNHVIRFHIGKDPHRGSLIHLDAGIIRIDLSGNRRIQYKSCRNTHQHIGTGTVADHLFPFCFQRTGQKIIGRCFSVRSAHHIGLETHLRGQIPEYARIYFHGQLSGHRNALLSGSFTSETEYFCRQDRRASTNLHENVFSNLCIAKLPLPVYRPAKTFEAFLHIIPFFRIEDDYNT